MRQQAERNGRRKHPLYETYAGMFSRCYNKNKKDYINYGGRGVLVCERWIGLNGFKNFVNDMGPKPSPYHTLDRRDNDGNYGPDNCRWATYIEQANNRRKRKIVRGKI